MRSNWSDNSNFGKMLEWLKRQTWKVCNGRKPFAGSNPALSAKQKIPQAELPAGFFAIR